MKLEKQSRTQSQPLDRSATRVTAMLRQVIRTSQRSKALRNISRSHQETEQGAFFMTTYSAFDPGMSRPLTLH